jgi:hypothetical protein
MTPAEQFFFDNAGYSYDPKVETLEQGRTRCAQRLAAAEAEADHHNWWVEWTDDGEEDGAPRWCALLRDNNSAVLGSLGGIDVCAGPYARVVAAELAADVFLLTPEQEQVKKLTGFTMDHLQALRHLQQRAELCRK